MLNFRLQNTCLNGVKGFIFKHLKVAVGQFLNDQRLPFIPQLGVHLLFLLTKMAASNQLRSQTCVSSSV